MNTDVRHEGRVFHVQTEDRVADTPKLVTQVFLSGQILKTVDSPYDAAVERDEGAIRQRLTKQHRLLIAAVMRGKIDPGDSPAPDPAVEHPTLVVTPLADPRAGERADLLILLRGDRTFRPVIDASLNIALDAGDGVPKAVHQGRTDAKGFHLAEVRLPESAAAELSLVVEAVCESGKARAVLPVLPGKSVAGRTATVLERAGLIVSDIEPPQRGRPASLMILVRSEPSTRPVEGAAVRVLVAHDDEPALELSRATTDRRGFYLAQVTVPESAGEGASLVVEATTVFGVAETVIPIV